MEGNLPAIVRPQGQELAISEERAERTRAYALKSKSPRTLKEYQRCWKQYAQWCESVGRNPLPLPAPVHDKGASVEERDELDAAYREAQRTGLATLASYVTWMADGQGTGAPRAVATVMQAVAAIKWFQAAKHCALDYDDPALQMVLQGVRRQISQSRTIRRVDGISAEMLADILDMLDLDNVRDARDAAAMALGWAAARRRSEVVGLDWQERGEGTGVLTIDEKGIHIHLMISKTHQEGEPEYYAVPRESVPKSIAAVENLIRLCGIAPGEPVFRGITNRGNATTGHIYRKTRMTPQTIANIIKARVRQYLKKKHPRWSRDRINAEVAKYSGHSMRVGHITDASERGVPTYKIQNQSGHKDSKMISVYSRVTDKLRDNSLKGVRSGL